MYGHIESFSIENFKSYREKQTLQLGTLSVLIGANASGKSNLIEAIKFANKLAEGNQLSSLEYNNNGLFRGAPTDLFNNGQETFSFGYQIIRNAFYRNEKDASENKPVELGILDFNTTISYRSNQLHIDQESLTENNNTSPCYRIETTSVFPDHDIAVSYDTYTAEKRYMVTCSDQYPVFTQLNKSTAFSPEHSKAMESILYNSRAVKGVLESIYFLDVQPQAMRDYVHIHDSVSLNTNGHNVSSVLYDLWNSGKETQTQILAFIQSLPEQHVKRLEFIETPKNEVMVQLVETFGNEEKAHDATLLSDGTLRVLAIAAALLSAPREALIIIEEVDNGVHPSRARELVNTIYKTAQERKIRVLLTTHNPALMDAIPQETLKDVTFSYRDPESGCSRLQRFEDMSNFPAFTLRAPLGQLVTTGIVDKEAKSTDTAQERKEKGLSFLESMGWAID